MGATGLAFSLPMDSSHCPPRLTTRTKNLRDPLILETNPKIMGATGLLFYLPNGLPTLHFALLCDQKFKKIPQSQTKYQNHGCRWSSL